MKSKSQEFSKNNSTNIGGKRIPFFSVLSMFLAITILSVSCKPSANEAGVTEESKQASIDSMKVVIDKQNAQIAKQKSIDSMQTLVNQQRSARQVNTHTTTTVTEKRKGWSRAAKGAVIGAGVGAITGAAVSKKKGEGAIIGGLAGAGLGAGTGAIIDSEKAKQGK